MARVGPRPRARAWYLVRLETLPQAEVGGHVLVRLHQPRRALRPVRAVLGTPPLDARDQPVLLDALPPPEDVDLLGGALVGRRLHRRRALAQQHAHLAPAPLSLRIVA